MRPLRSTWQRKEARGHRGKVGLVLTPPPSAPIKVEYFASPAPDDAEVSAHEVQSRLAWSLQRGTEADTGPALDVSLQPLADLVCQLDHDHKWHTVWWWWWWWLRRRRRWWWWWVAKSPFVRAVRWGTGVSLRHSRACMRWLVCTQESSLPPHTHTQPSNLNQMGVS